MTLLNLLDDLNDLCKILDTELNINEGGCCLLAYIIARELDKREIPYSLIIGNDYYKDELRISKEVNHMQTSYYNDSCVGYETCKHYFLKVLDNYINQDEVCDFEFDIPVTSYIPIKWIYEHGLWNNSYDTNNNSYVEDLIINLFNDYDKERRENQCL